MSHLPNCPKCNSEFTYEDGDMFICPECSHEWPKEAVGDVSEQDKVIKDANGTVIKDLKVKGTSLVVQVGTNRAGRWRS